MADDIREQLASVVERAPSPFIDGGMEDREAWRKLCNLQRRILAQVAPQVPGYSLALSYRPGFVVTGDYHDFFARPDRRTAVFVGDGSGHGPAASMLMAMMYTILRTHEVHREPGETLTKVGRLFCPLVPSDLFMTGVYLVLGDCGEVSWSAAGHHPPLWLGRSGRLAPIDLAPVGQVLGFSAEENYSTVRWDLELHDRLLLFTDGLWEARSRAGEPFGRPRLCAHLAETVNVPLGEVIRGLVARVAEHMEGADFEDDFTIVGVERRQ